MKIKLIILFLGSLFQLHVSLAQTEEDQVKAVIESLFDGMRDKNPDQVALAFSEDALMQTVIVKEGGNEIGSNKVSDFVKRISETPEGTNLDERILDYQIKVDGFMASAWTPYEFFVNDEFSHCGVNSFQLVKLATGWKIVYIIDTRRQEPCS